MRPFCTNGNAATGFGLAIVLAVGVGLRAWTLGSESLWLDEAHSLVQAQRWIPGLWSAAVVSEPNPPLYFTILSLWLRIFGTTETAARSLSVLFGSVTIIAVFALGMMTAGRRVAVAAAALAATSPLLVVYSREARGYALAIAAAATCICGAMWLLLRLHPEAVPSVVKAQLRRRELGALAWTAYVASAVIAIYTHNTMVLLPVIVNLTFLLLWTSRPVRDWRFAAAWSTANAVVILAYLPWLPIVLGNLEEMQTFWVPPVSIEEAVVTVRGVYGHGRATDFPTPVDAGLLALALLGLASLRRVRPACVLYGSVLVLVPCLTYVVSIYRPIFIPRVLLWPLPVLAVVLASGAVRGRSIHASTAILGLVLVTQFLALANPAMTTKHEPWRDVVEMISSERREGDAVIIAPSYAAMPFEYYAGPDDKVVTVAMVRPARPSAHWSYKVIAPSDVPAILSRHERAWFLALVDAPEPGIEDLAAQIGRDMSLRKVYEAQSITVRLFVRQN